MRLGKVDQRLIILLAGTEAPREIRRLEVLVEVGAGWIIELGEEVCQRGSVAQREGLK